MAGDPFFWAALIAALIVLGVLILGIGTFGKGGETNRKHANKIMRIRLIAQLIAVILIVLLVYLRKEGA